MHRHNIVTKIIAIRLFIHSWAHLHVVNFLFLSLCRLAPKRATIQRVPRLLNPARRRRWRHTGRHVHVARALPGPVACLSDHSRFSLANGIQLNPNPDRVHSATSAKSSREHHICFLKSFGYLYAEVEYTLVQGSSLESCTALRSTSSSVRDP